MFSAALASGQLGPLMCQFGLPAEAVEAANKGGKYLLLLPRPRRFIVLELKGQASLGWHRVGCPHGLGSAALGQGLGRRPHASPRVSDVEAFAKAMQNNARLEQKEGDGKDKKDEEEDMSLD